MRASITDAAADGEPVTVQDTLVDERVDYVADTEGIRSLVQCPTSSTVSSRTGSARLAQSESAGVRAAPFASPRDTRPSSGARRRPAGSTAPDRPWHPAMTRRRPALRPGPTARKTHH